MLSAAAQEHERGLGNWPAEWETLPEIALLAAGALAAMADVAPGLDVDAERMRANLELTQGQIFAEAVQMALATALGRDCAHALVADACRRAAKERVHLREVLRAVPEVASALRLRRPSTACSIPPTTSAKAAASSSARLLRTGGPEGATRTCRSPMPAASACTTGSTVTPPRRRSSFPIRSGPRSRCGSRRWRRSPRAFASSATTRAGHGESEVTPGPYTIAMLGADVVALLDALAIPRAHFCGLSMGGMTGMWLGVNAPERIDRLVLANTAAKIGTADLWNARIDAIRKGGMAAVASAVLARWFTPALLEQPTPMVARLRASLERTSAEGYVACCAAVRDMDQRRALSGIHVPTLVIAGSVDLSTPPDDGRYIAEHIPGAHYVELQAPHLSNVEAATRFRRMHCWNS